MQDEARQRAEFRRGSGTYNTTTIILGFTGLPLISLVTTAQKVRRDSRKLETMHERQIFALESTHNRRIMNIIDLLARDGIHRSSLLFLLLLTALTSKSHGFTCPLLASKSNYAVALASSTLSQETTDPSSISSPMERVGINSRGAKMNEIDFTLAPSDVSLSRCYQISRDGNTAAAKAETQEQRVQTLSLTRALNTASNRAVRRILLARSWPSAEALNLSLRTVLMQQQSQQQEMQPVDEKEDKAKCPVPRPILNILMNRREGDPSNVGDSTANNNPTPRTGQDKERQWVATQLAAFKESYQNIPGYEAAETYLECILSLATTGVESGRVSEVRYVLMLSIGMQDLIIVFNICSHDLNLYHIRL